MHITQNRSAANPLPWNMWETCSKVTNRVASFVQPLFETLSSMATPALNASISIGKLTTSKTYLTVSLVALSLASGASTPSPTPMAPTEIPDFLINTYTSGSQYDPNTAAFFDGSFIVTWRGEGAGDTSGIFGQRFFPNGSAWGPEFRANNYTNGDQGLPSTATFSDGSFVVTWEGEGVGDDQGIFGQLFFANGSAWGSEFRANNYTNGNQNRPSTISFSDGTFIVTWWGEGAGDASGIFGQRFFANGSAWSSEFRTNNYTSGSQLDPSTAPFSDGSFVVIWGGNGAGDIQDISGQRFHANGSSWGSEFRANNYTNGRQRFPSTAPFSDGSFVVTWDGEGAGGDSQGIFGQRFFANGSAWGSEFQANNYTSGSQLFSSTAPFSDGSFVVTWYGAGTGGTSGIFGQRFFANGSAWGSEFQANTYVSGQDPSTVSFPDGTFVVTWWNTDIYGKRFDRFGWPIPWEEMSFSPSGSTQSTPNSSASVLISTDTSFPNQMTLESSTSMGNTFSSSPAPLQSVDSSIPSSLGQTLGSSTRLDNTIPVLTTLVYSEPYPITLNGQSIGTFSLSGGTGQFSSNNPNTLDIEFDSDYVIEDGLTLTLFAVPDGEQLTFENLSLTSSNSECFTAEGEWISSTMNQGESMYQLLIAEASCTLYTEASKVTVMPVLMGLV